MTENSLVVEDLTVSYGPVTAVDRLSLSVEPGAIVALVGANGAGKSTTVRSISGLVKGRSGTIVLNGKDVTRLPAYRRSRLGLAHVPEGRNLFGRLSVAQNLHVAASTRSKTERASQIEQVTDLFPELANRLDQAAGSLSGGEQQMVALGRALVADPGVVMLDEPALGLAPIIVSRVAEAIQRLAAEGRAVLLAEQHIDMAVRCADEIHVMTRGSLSRRFAADEAGLDPELLKSEILSLIMA